MIKLSLLSLLLANGLVKAGPITKDMDTNHDHDAKYFEELKTKPIKTPNGGPLIVHLVPHSHDDVGWLKTVEQYFSGAHYNTQKAGVELIISTVINELIEDPVKRFSLVEMKFFTMWWKYQTDDLKNKVRQLVKEGRLEFLNAGWSMSDEACPHYEDFINNMFIGHQFLLEEFGVKPRVGWHIDPFGHSNVSPRLFADMGFDAWFFARLDYQDKDRRLADLEMEFLWRPMYNHFGKSKQILTHALYQHYSAPSGFSFDTYSGDDGIVDDPTLSSYNLDTKVQQFHDYLVHQAQHYINTGHLFVVMGDDFQYANAKMNFYSMDRLIKGFNAKFSDMQLRYSTPSEYLDAISQQNVQWPTKYDDMFPYSDDMFSFWTGYFTSRSNDKDYIRRGSHNLHASSKLYSFNAIETSVTQQRLNDMMNAQYKMMDVMGILQHHDSVTGTGKQAVADNYAWKMYKALQANNPVFSQVLSDILQGQTGVSFDDAWDWCFRENTTFVECPIGKKDPDGKVNMHIAAFNPSTDPTNYTQIAVPHGAYKVQVYDWGKKQFVDATADVICDQETFYTKDVKNCQLFVEYTIQGLTVGIVNIQYDTTVDLTVKQQNESPIQVSNLYEKITQTEFNDYDGVVFQIQKLLYSQNYKIGFDLRYWKSYQGDFKDPSGVYMFSTDFFSYDTIRYSHVQTIFYYQGKVVQQITITFNDPVTLQSGTVKLRLYRLNPVQEWNVKLDSIPNTGQGMEVTVNFKSLDIDNNKTFYTDANGLEMQKRVLNYRPSWELEVFDNITSNYYPIQTAVAIRDTQNKHQMTVMNARSQGCSVLKTGRIEIMHNRRTYYDDHRGMGEGMNEVDENGNGITTINSYYLQIFDRDHEESEQRYTQLHQDEPLQYFFNFKDLKQEILEKKQPKMSGKFLSENHLKMVGLPRTTKVELFPMSQNSLMLRLENIADKFDLGSNPTIPYVKLDDLANTIYQLSNGADVTPSQTIISETTLTGNQLYSYMQGNKIQWTGKDDNFINPPVQPLDKSSNEIALEAQRIRTYMIQYITFDQPQVNNSDPKEFLN